MLYSQQLTKRIVEPKLDLKWLGVVLFLIGISGNFDHHYLISKLKDDESRDRKYRIPRRGLFNLVICPHYLFEILEFWRISCISQTLYPSWFSLSSTFFLMVRNYNTRR